MDHEPSAKNLGHFPTSFLIAYARILRTSGDIELAVNDCSKLDFIESAFQGLLN
jgi:hypothetical protein